MSIAFALSAPLPAHTLISSHATYYSHSSEDGQPWDAARCCRLLRQLQSRLAVLRKLQSPILPFRQESENHPRPERRVKDAVPKHARQKYNSRKLKLASKRNVSTPAPQLRTLKSLKPLLFSSPCSILNLNSPARTEQVINCDAPIPPKGKYKKSERFVTTEIASKMLELKNGVSVEHFKAYEGVFDLVTGLLQSTKPRNQDGHGKSLLAMCLRRIPNCLERIEEWDKESLHNKGLGSTWNPASASMEIYGQLEAFGGSSRRWKPMAIAITSHIVNILRREIDEGNFITQFIRVLEDLFLYYGRGDDAAALAAAAAHADVKRDQDQLLHNFDTVNNLLQILQRSSQRRLGLSVLEHATNILQSGSLPVYLSSPNVAVLWKVAIKNIEGQMACPSALQFLYLAMRGLVTSATLAHKNEEERTLINVLAGIVNLAKHDTRIARRRSLLLVEECLAQSEAINYATRDSTCFILALVKAIIAAEDTSNVAVQSVVELGVWVSKCHSNELRRLTICLLSASSRYRSQNVSAYAYECITEACTMLDNLDMPHWLSGGLHRATAFHLAEETRDLRDLAYAESLMPNDDMKAADSEWRWESGLGEWVLKTPPRNEAATSRLVWKAKARISLPLELENGTFRTGQQRFFEMPARRPPRHSLCLAKQAAVFSEHESFRSVGYRIPKRKSEPKRRRTVMLLTELTGSKNDLTELD